jgi:putative flippase GtrA
MWYIMDENDIKRQMTLYLTFAAAMIGLNYLIQKLNELVVAPFICTNFGTIDFIYVFYCSTEIFNMPELIGSIVAVGITYIIKFFLDKHLVFKKTGTGSKQTSIEFTKYFGFAILTTIENIGIQFLMTNFLKTPLEINVVVALCIGYLTKFFLDRKFVFGKKIDLDLENNKI